MHRTACFLVSAALGLCLMLSLTAPAWAQKGRSYSSGAPSYSGSRSSGRSSFGGGGSSSRSFPSTRGGSPGGVTFNKRSPGSGFDTAASQAQRHAESQRRYDNRGSTPQPFPSGRDYSTNSRSTSPHIPPGGGWQKPTRQVPPSPFDKSAADAQRREESRQRYERGNAPRPTYPDSQGNQRPVDRSDPGVIVLGKPGFDWWIRREHRQRDFQRRFPVPANQPIIVYSDPYSTAFWYWILAQDLATRAAWGYHHHTKMDPARYHDLLAKDAAVEPEINKLESTGVHRDPAYLPPNIEPDLMYTDDFVDAVVNPVPRTIDTTFIETVGWILAALALLAALYWFIFIKRWGATIPTPRVPHQGNLQRQRGRNP